MPLTGEATRFARSWALALVGVAAALAGPGTLRALADDAPFVGVWVIEPRNCGAPPADPNSPMEISNDGYDQHLTHCSFKSVDQQGGDYRIAAECDIDGTTQQSRFTLTVSGNTLTFTDETGARDFLRCQ